MKMKPIIILNLYMLQNLTSKNFEQYKIFESLKVLNYLDIKIFSVYEALFSVNILKMITTITKS